MEQQQFRVKFSLGTKLVISLSVLFIVVVGFLATSAVRLVVEDRKAYTYQLQSMESYVASRDFSEKVRLGLDNLRLFLTSFDPRQPITASQADSLKSLVSNQQGASAVVAFAVNAEGIAKFLTGYTHPELGTQLALQNLVPDAAFFREAMPRLIKNSYSLSVYRQQSGIPLLAIAFADVSLKDHPGGMPIAIGFYEYDKLQINRRFGELRIAGLDGTTLFSTEARDLKTPTSLSDHVLFQVASSSAANVQTGAKEFEQVRPSEKGELKPVKFLGTWQKTPYGAVVISQVPMSKAMEAAFRLAEQLTYLGIVSLAAAILFAIFFAATITKPLKALHRATAQVAQGNFNVDPKVKTRDEVGQLSNSFVSMSKKIQDLLVETRKNAHIEEELKVAAAVQESLIPPPEYNDSQLEIIGHYQSATECGGDWWGFFRVENKICVMIADATGHGIPSALITASARSCFSVIHKLAREQTFFRLNPGEMMSYANKVVFDAAMTKIMMTFFIGVIDLEARTITYSNAGHNPPWLFRKTGERFQLKSLMPKGNRLGELEESGQYEEASLPIDTGDILFLYTDGLLENKNTQGEMYGKKRARQVIEEALAGGPRMIISRLTEAYRKYNETKPLDDDVTLAAIRILS